MRLQDHYDAGPQEWEDDLSAEELRQLHEDCAHADALDALEAFGLAVPTNATKDDVKRLLKTAAYQLHDIADRLNLARKH